VNAFLIDFLSAFKCADALCASERPAPLSGTLSNDSSTVPRIGAYAGFACEDELPTTPLDTRASSIAFSMSSTASDCASARVRVDFIRQSGVPALHSRVRAPPFARRSRLHPRFARIHRIAPSRPLASLPFVRRRRLAVVSSASSNQIVSRRPIVARLPSSRSRTCSSRVMSGEYCVRFSSLNSDELIVVLVRALRRRVDDDDDEDRGERGRCRGRWDSLEVYNSLA